ncbi:hypothetical protein LCGC14_0911150 [marine sediment metagenome]|uniref:Uncharacterized protein n=1 Tax=marine sediment metagenome TaxID=412755 RepID=A0A0F9NYC8_9ZZZZ
METLSDKEEKCFCDDVHCEFRKYRAEDVNEFIRLLKERTKAKWVHRVIDELAGDKLNG